jgi:hypothetical protein
VEWKAEYAQPEDQKELERGISGRIKGLEEGERSDEQDHWN